MTSPSLTTTDPLPSRMSSVKKDVSAPISITILYLSLWTSASLVASTTEDQRRLDLLDSLVRWVRLRDKDSMASNPLMFSRGPKSFTLLHPPMVCSQFTVSQSMLNPDPSTASPFMASPLTASQSMLNPDLSTEPLSRSMASVSNSPIRLSVPVPSLTVNHKSLVPTVSSNQQSPQPSEVESSAPLSAKLNRPLLLILKNQQSPRHLKYPRSQPLMPMLSHPVTAHTSKVFLKSRAATKHQLFLRCPHTQDLVDKRVAMASQLLTLPSSHLSLQREEAATAHSEEANVAATVAPATVVPRAASAASVLPRVASAPPRAAMAAKATANPREDSANPEVDMAAPEADTVPLAVPLALPRVPLAPPRAASAHLATAHPEVATVAPEAASLRVATASPEVDMAAPEAASPNPEVDMAAPEADTEEAAREASADSTNSKASEVKAAMALPEAAQVMVVDLVESAPTAAVVMAVPDMEAQEDGEELSFCVYGLNA